MSIPVFWKFFRPILTSLGNGDVLTADDLYLRIVPEMGLSSDELSEMTAGGTRTKVRDRVYWSKSYLKAAGLVRYPGRGLAQITDAGKTVLNENPPLFDINYLKKFESFRKFIGQDLEDSDSMFNVESIETRQYSQTPQELMDSAFLEVNAALRNEILNELTSEEQEDVTREQARFFEKLVVKLLEEMGYGGLQGGAGIVTPSTNDGGIDGIIREDKLGFSNIYIQAKCYSLGKKVGRPEIERFIGATSGLAGKALFITTAEFTAEAKEKAKHANVVLVDGEELADLMIEYGVGVSRIRTYETKKLDSDFFEER